MNCWDYKKCGRQPGGENIHEFGECPAVSAFSTHGVNNGINGGRACWAIAGTYCEGKPQGNFVDKLKGCAVCDFFAFVKNDVGKQLLPVPKILEIYVR